MSIKLSIYLTFSQFVRFGLESDLYLNLKIFSELFMGLLNKLFGTSTEEKEEKTLNWIPLNEVSQLHVIEKQSHIKTQVIFKYSTRCGISRMVLNEFENDFDFEKETFNLYFLDLIRYREVSNKVSEFFNVVHESPQLLVVKDGKTVAHNSHGAINDMDLKQFIAQ